MEKRDTQKETGIQSVGRAMQILNCLLDAKRPLSLAELSAAAKLPKSTAHGLVSTLRQYGMVEQTALDGKYRLGVRLFELGSAVAGMWDVRGAAKPYLQNICLQVNESVHLAKLDGEEALIIDRMDSGSQLRIMADPGTRLPLHCSALGKVMLAFLPESERRRLLQKKGLPSYTPHTITDMDAMQTELGRIKTEGYAIEDGELMIGMRSVAAPIFDNMGQAIFAIGTAGLFRRITDERFCLATELCCQAAQAISSILGYRP